MGDFATGAEGIFKNNELTLFPDKTIYKGFVKVFCSFSIESTVENVFFYLFVNEGDGEYNSYIRFWQGSENKHDWGDTDKGFYLGQTVGKVADVFVEYSLSVFPEARIVGNGRSTIAYKTITRNGDSHGFVNTKLPIKKITIRADSGVLTGSGRLVVL